MNLSKCCHAPVNGLFTRCSKCGNSCDLEPSQTGTPGMEPEEKCPNPNCYGGKLREKFPGRVQYINDCPDCHGTGIQMFTGGCTCMMSHCKPCPVHGKKISGESPVSSGVESRHAKTTNMCGETPQEEKSVALVGSGATSDAGRRIEISRRSSDRPANESPESELVRCPECNGSGMRKCGMDANDPVESCYWCGGGGFVKKPEPPIPAPAPQPAVSVEENLHDVAAHAIAQSKLAQPVGEKFMNNESYGYLGDFRTLYEFILNGLNRTDPFPAIDYQIRAEKVTSELGNGDSEILVRFYIHAEGRDSETPVFTLYPPKVDYRIINGHETPRDEMVLGSGYVNPPVYIPYIGKHRPIGRDLGEPAPDSLPEGMTLGQVLKAAVANHWKLEGTEFNEAIALAVAAHAVEQATKELREEIAELKSTVYVLRSQEPEVESTPWEVTEHENGDDREQLMLRSVAAMAIAEGDEGWENLPIDCPMLEAVARLRQKYNMLCAYPKPTIKEVLDAESLTTENAALRAALEKIADNIIHPENPYVMIARAALAAHKKPEPTKRPAIGPPSQRYS